MARTNNLTNFLTDVSAAIKQKTGDSTPIPAANFDTEILSIETAGTYQTKSLSITTNGSYQLLPDQDYDAMDRVNISVAVPSENLDSVITAQENKLDALEEILENKVSGSAKPNIYVQDVEPSKKDGVWLKMSNTEAEHFISDDNIFIGGTWAPASETASIPYNFYNGSAASVGTNVYLFGGSGGNTNTYKYNTLTNTYTQLTNIPFAFGGNSLSATTVDTNIYLFTSSNNTYNYAKYDTLTDTYTEITNLGELYGKTTASVGTDIYIFAYGNGVYKYDTLTGVNTKVANSPISSYGPSAVVAVGSVIYAFGIYNQSYSSDRNTYKFDTTSNSWASLGMSPITLSKSYPVAVGTDIYLLGSDAANGTAFYKYNTLTNTYTQLSNLPSNVYNGAAVGVGIDIYLLGGNNNRTTNRKYHAENKSYETDNTVIVAQGKTYNIGYNVKIYNLNGSTYPPLYGFADAWFYTLEDGLITDMPVYYGDGTQWINIKNPPVEEVEE